MSKKFIKHEKVDTVPGIETKAELVDYVIEGFIREKVHTEKNLKITDVMSIVDIEPSKNLNNSKR